jgi:hypothetical protein
MFVFVYYFHNFQASNSVRPCKCISSTNRHRSKAAEYIWQ